MKIKHLLLIVFLSVVFLLPLKHSCAESTFDLMFGKRAGYENVTVQEVVSPDTIIIEDETQNGETIKLIGLKAPAHERRREPIDRDSFGFEIKQEESPLLDVDEEAYEFVKELLLGKKVNLEFDSYKKNESHQTLAYVFLSDNNVFVNEEILANGCAHLQIQPPNLKYSQRLRDAYKRAKTEQKGFHGE